MAVYSCIYSLVLASNPQVYFSMHNFHLLAKTFSRVHLVNPCRLDAKSDPLTCSRPS